MTAPSTTAKYPNETTMASFIEGNLDSAANRQIVEHLANCAGCRTSAIERKGQRIQHFGFRRTIVITSVVIVGTVAAVWIFLLFLHRDRAMLPVVALSESLPFRSIEGRLTGGFPYRPLKHPKDRIGLESLWRLKSIATASKLPASTRAIAEDLHVRSAAHLVLGESGQGVALLEQSVQNAVGELDVLRAIDACSDANLLTDLAAAYHERALAEGSARDRVSSLDAAERAWRLAQSPETAWNRAVALEAMHLRPEAAAAWWHYLELDSSSEWSTEARHRIQNLLPHADAWQQTRWQLEHQEQIQARGVAERLREFIEEEMLPQWSRAVESGRTAAAADILNRAAFAAHQLCAQTGECLAFDSIERIGDVAAHDTVDTRVVAAGFRAWRTAEDLGKQKPDLRMSNLSRAMYTFREAGLPLTARLEMRIVNAHFDANDWTSGLSTVKAIAETYPYEMTRSPLLRGQMARYRGMFLIATGHSGEALASYQNALAEFSAISIDANTGMTELLIAENLRHLGEMDEAWEYHLRAVEHLDRANEPLRLVIAISSAGKTAAREKNDRVALVLDEAALAIARRERRPEYECQALVSRALIANASATDGERYVREAEDAWNRIPDEATRRRFAIELQMGRSIAVARTSPDRAIDALSRAHDMAIEYHDPFRFARVHLLRARLYEGLNHPEAAEADLRTGIEEIERQRARIDDGGLRARFIETGDELFSALAENLVSRDRIAEALDVAEQRRARVLKEKLHPWNGSLAEAPRAADIQKRLPAGVAVIEYLWSNDEVLFWLLTRQSVVAGRVPAARTVDRKLRRLQETTSTGAAADLYELILSQVPLHGIRHLLVVPDGPLSRLPFSMLYDRQERRYLIEKCAISVIPSIAFAVDGQSSKAIPPLASILIVSDPLVAPQYAGVAPPLLGARREAALVTAFGHSVVLQGENARASRFLQMATTSEVIHFAGHALGGSATHPAALALTPDSVSRDGLLGVEEVERQVLPNTRLVVLAACSTSTGRVGSEGTMSLARAFAAAGARNVVASLWPVDDEATARLWPIFYGALKRGLSPAEALREAQVHLLRNPTDSSPRNWAAFQVTGPV